MSQPSTHSKDNCLAQKCKCLNFSWNPDRRSCLCAGMLPELDSMAKVLEMQDEWADEALELRLEMMDILSGVAEAYIQAGIQSDTLTQICF